MKLMIFVLLLLLISSATATRDRRIIDVSDGKITIECPNGTIQHITPENLCAWP